MNCMGGSFWVEGAVDGAMRGASVGEGGFGFSQAWKAKAVAMQMAHAIARRLEFIGGFSFVISVVCRRGGGVIILLVDIIIFGGRVLFNFVIFMVNESEDY